MLRIDGARRIFLARTCGVLFLTLGACAPPFNLARAAHSGTPPGVTIVSSGFATLLHAPPSTARVLRPPRVESEQERIARERGISLSEADSLMNPDEAARRDARFLDQRLKALAADNDVGVRIVRDPDPRFAFQFRRDAAATLAAFTSDSRFVALDGGRTRKELQPLFDAWWKRFEPNRILGGGSVREFDGDVQFEMTIDEAGYRSIAAREGWAPPPQVRLHFPPPANPRSVDPALAPLVRVFAREDRLPAVVLTAAISGHLILRDGCFRLLEPGDDKDLVLFGRDMELGLDEEGYMVVTDPRGDDSFGGPTARVGERIVWSGPRVISEADEGVKALRAACGSGQIVAVGEPQSERRFELSRSLGP